MSREQAMKAANLIVDDMDELVLLSSEKVIDFIADKIVEIYGNDNAMSLRDLFAANALQGLLANPKLQNEILKQGGACGGWIETSAYGFADAMLKARGDL